MTIFLLLHQQKKDTRMHELMRLAHEFLQCFCLGNKNNQALLHKNLELFLTPSVSIIYYHWLDVHFQLQPLWDDLEQLWVSFSFKVIMGDDGSGGDSNWFDERVID